MGGVHGGGECFEQADGVGGKFILTGECWIEMIQGWGLHVPKVQRVPETAAPESNCKPSACTPSVSYIEGTTLTAATL